MLPYTAHDLITAVSQDFTRGDARPTRIAGQDSLASPTKDLRLSAALRSVRMRIARYAR